MPHLPSSYPPMIYVYVIGAFILVGIIVVARIRHMMRLHSVALLGQEIASWEAKQVQHVTCDCCRRHRKIVSYSHNHKEAWVCLPCDKLLRRELGNLSQARSVKHG